jgi:hypothetical protein
MHKITLYLGECVSSLGFVTVIRGATAAAASDRCSVHSLRQSRVYGPEPLSLVVGQAWQPFMASQWHVYPVFAQIRRADLSSRYHNRFPQALVIFTECRPYA